MELISYPYYVPVAEYMHQIEIALDQLKKLDGVIAIYQVGSVSTPGISDIDLFVVFEDEISCQYDLLKDSGHIDRYLFNHRPFAATGRQMKGVQLYTFIHNFKLLWGTECRNDINNITDEEKKYLLKQTALEYLLKMYINMSVERSFGAIKVRSLLLHMKGLMYDMEYLNVTSGELVDEISRIITWREGWFENIPSKYELSEWHGVFFELLGELLHHSLKENKLYVPEQANHMIARNIKIIEGENLECTRRGLVLPAVLSHISMKIFNIQYRINRFNFSVPLSREAEINVIEDRYKFLSGAYAYLRKNLPGFMLPGSSLAIFHDRHM